MHKYITLFFSVSLLLFSCRRSNTPDNIIDHDEMISLLTEVHLADGRTYGASQSVDSLNKYGTARFDVLFKRFHTDSSTFRNSLKYYATQPAELQKIYDQILLNLKHKTDSISKKQHVADSLQRIKTKKNAIPQQ